MYVGLCYVSTVLAEVSPALVLQPVVLGHEENSCTSASKTRGASQVTGTRAALLIQEKPLPER